MKEQNEICEEKEMKRIEIFRKKSGYLHIILVIPKRNLLPESIHSSMLKHFLRIPNTKLLFSNRIQKYYKKSLILLNYTTMLLYRWTEHY